MIIHRSLLYIWGKSIVIISVVDPNTLNLDPDPRFLAQFGSESRARLSILKEKLKIILEKSKNKTTPFASILSYIYKGGTGFGSVFGIQIRIRIHKAPEYGSNTNLDPDPQHCWILYRQKTVLSSGGVWKCKSKSTCLKM